MAFSRRSAPRETKRSGLWPETLRRCAFPGLYIDFITYRHLPSYNSGTFYNMTDYDSLHRQCRTLESLFDTKLTSYSRLATTITRQQDDVEAGGSAERWKDLEAEVDELLQKV